MDNISIETSSRSSSLKDFESSSSAINMSIKSTKSLDKSNKSEKIQFKDSDFDNQHIDPAVKVHHKIIANWKHACDKTKDRTKDLLKKWRTLPETDGDLPGDGQGRGVDTNGSSKENSEGESKWSVHIWTTWVDRFSIESDKSEEDVNVCLLTPTQSNKFAHFFDNLLDYDRDNLVNEQDFKTFTERLRHFADWSENCSEYNTLREVERGFVETFLHNINNEKHGFVVNQEHYVTKEGWLHTWAKLLYKSRKLNDFPVWLQVFPRVLFQVINRSGTGIVTKEELNSFYASVLGYDTSHVREILGISYKRMTSNGDHPLKLKVYRLCFINYLVGRFPNGPGQYILGAPPLEASSVMFPIDYSALNSDPEDLEQYTPDQKSNRRSVIV